MNNFINFNCCLKNEKKFYLSVKFKNLRLIKKYYKKLFFFDNLSLSNLIKKPKNSDRKGYFGIFIIDEFILFLYNVMPFAKVSKNIRCRIKIPHQLFIHDFIKFSVLSLIWGRNFCLYKITFLIYVI